MGEMAELEFDRNFDLAMKREEEAEARLLVAQQELHAAHALVMEMLAYGMRKDGG